MEGAAEVVPHGEAWSVIAKLKWPRIVGSAAIQELKLHENEARSFYLLWYHCLH